MSSQSDKITALYCRLSRDDEQDGLIDTDMGLSGLVPMQNLFNEWHAAYGISA